MVVNNEAEQLLAELGLTEYEARAYVALLRCQPATAYELAKVSGIPSSKIYEQVNRLSAKGLAQPTSEQKDRGQSYIALNADDFVQSRREETMRKTEQLGPLLRAISNQGDADFIWQLTEAEAVYDKARQLVQNAAHSILVSLWPEELSRFEADLLEAEERGVRIALVHFGLPRKQIGATFHHPAEQTIYQEKGGRGLTLVADSQCVVIATFFDNGKVEGAWSRNRAFVIVAEDYIRHDVYITKVAATMDDQLKEHFGADYHFLRDVFEPVE